jgi:iron-sulfur cluster assembly protein
MKLLHFTPPAIKQAREALAEWAEEGDRLRVFVVGGGRSGLQYGIDFDQEERAGDAVMDFDGLKVVVDAFSAEHLRGTVVDYTDAPGGTGFRFVRPNAT